MCSARSKRPGSGVLSQRARWSLSTTIETRSPIKVRTHLHDDMTNVLIDFPPRPSDWFPITREKALAGSTAMDVYYAAKTLAEQDLWAFADAHPNLDITTSNCFAINAYLFMLTFPLVNPPFLYGPFADDFDLPTPDYYALSGNIYIYRLLDSSGVFPPYPGHADVRDAANAHVLALASPPNSAVGRKRILFASPHGFSYAAVIELIARERPALKERLIKMLPPELLIDRTPVDFGRIQQVLGLSKSDFKTVEDTMLSTVDSLLEIEKKWVAQGHQISIPHP